MNSVTLTKFAWSCYYHFNLVYYKMRKKIVVKKCLYLKKEHLRFFSDQESHIFSHWPPLTSTSSNLAQYFFLLGWYRQPLIFFLWSISQDHYVKKKCFLHFSVTPATSKVKRTALSSSKSAVVQRPCHLDKTNSNNNNIARFKIWETFNILGINWLYLTKMFSYIF